jgi:hypothetical protein
MGNDAYKRAVLVVDHIRAKSIFLLIAFANLGFHPRLDLGHGLVECFTDQFLYDFVGFCSRQRVQKRPGSIFYLA